MPSAPEALAGGPTQAAPGVRGEEEQWAREIGAQLRRMADDLNAQYERRVSAGRAGGRWDFPQGGGSGRPRQMCGSCWPVRRGRGGDRRAGCPGAPEAGVRGLHGPARPGAARRGQSPALPWPAAAGTEGGARRSGSYILGYL